MGLLLVVCMQAALKGAVEDLALAVASAASTVRTTADTLINQQDHQQQQRAPSPRQHAADVQQAQLSSTTAGAIAAKQHLHNSLSALHDAVKAAVEATSAQREQNADLQQHVEQLHAELQQASTTQEELQSQVDGLQDLFAAAGREADAAKAQLQEVRAACDTELCIAEVLLLLIGVCAHNAGGKGLLSAGPVEMSSSM